MRTADSDKALGEFPQPAGNILYGFLDSWLFWVESGAEHRHPYSRNTGLCDNFWEYARNRHLSTWEGVSAENLLQEALEDSFGDGIYPFGEENFYKRLAKKTQHEDPDRIAWVKQYLSYEQDNV